jgi:CheY-like chemotaxis protein
VNIFVFFYCIDCAPHEHVATILIIDDDLPFRESLAEFLRFQGYAVAEVDNGRDGLARLRGGDRPDVILLDLRMPKMNGWQFLASFAQDRTLDMPVIVLSGDAHLVPRSPSVFAALRKTVDPTILLSTIQLAVSAEACRRFSIGPQ